MHRTNALRSLLAVAAPLIATLILPPVARAAVTITVNSVEDAATNNGNCTLAEAIAAANDDETVDACSHDGSGGLDTIEFDLPGTGVRTISPSTALPAIADPVVIDGLTQAGADCSSWPPTLLVEISRGGSVDSGLQLAAGSGGSTIRGLVVNGFNLNNFSAGIRIESDGNRIECNFLGTDAAGSDSKPNSAGIDIVSSDSNIIGTDGSVSAVGRRNLLSGNDDFGLSTRGVAPSGNLIAGNYIGTTAVGTAALGNGFYGVTINGNPSAAMHNVVGYDGNGAMPAEMRNIISGNGDAGVQMTVGAQQNQVAGNYIGTDPTGTLAIPNKNGVSLGSNNSVFHNLVGYDGTGDIALERNVISGNTISGVICNGANGTKDNAVVGNFIGTNFDSTAPLPNGLFGISLSSGSDALVAGNLIAHNPTGIQLFASGSGRATPIFLNGVTIPGYGTATSELNCIESNGVGVIVSASSGATASNTTFEQNWWGAADGPGGAGSGSGDTVSSQVDFAPFLTSPPSNCRVGMAVVKSFDPSQIQVGATSLVRIAIDNPNLIALTDVTFTDLLPAGVTAVSAASPQCGGDVDVSNPIAIVFGGMQPGTVGAQDSCTIEVTVQGTAEGTHTNPPFTVQAQAVIPTAQSNAASLIVVEGSTVIKSFADAAVALGAETLLLVAIQNDNDIAFTGLEFTDVLPAGLAATSAASPQCGGDVDISDPTQIVFGANQAGGVAANSSCTVQVEVAGIAVGTQTNAPFTVQSDNVIPDSTSNAASIQVLGPPTVVQSFAAPTVALHDTTQLTIQLAHGNDVALGGLRFTSLLPSGLRAASAASPQCGGDVDVSDPTRIELGAAQPGSIPADASCTVVVPVEGTEPGTQQNAAFTVTADPPVPSAASNTATIAVVTSPVVDAVFVPAQTTPNGEVELQVTLVNPNSVPLTELAFVIPLPPGLSAVGAAAPQCGGSVDVSDPAQVVFGAAPGGVLEASGVPDAMCTVAVQVRADGEGSFVVAPFLVEAQSGIPAGSSSAATLVAAAAAIPTASTLGLLALAVLVAAIGVCSLRRCG